MANNIVTATFNASHFAVTPSIYRYNYGNILVFDGIENLPEYFEVHFANRGDKTTTQWLGQDGQVEIPNDYLETGKQIVAYIYLHETAADGETVYKVLIPVRDREEPEDVQPTPEQQTALEAAIYALNTETGVATEAAAAAEESAQRAEEAAASIDEGMIADAVADYLDEHPITVDETDPTVPEWAKQPNKPSYSASEVGAVPAEAGKGLSTNDYTTAEKEKLAGIEAGADKTPDLSGFATKTELNGKVDKVSGKGLSTNDYTTAEKNKLSGIEAGAQKNPDLSHYVTDSDYDPDSKTSAQTQPVGVDANGKLWTAPGGSTITVDDALSSTSTNPVQNKVVKAALDGKGTYSKPSGGIPANDLASAVQTSLGKADTALQSVPSTYRTAAAQDTIDSGKIDKPSNPTSGQFLVYNGTTWAATTVPSANGVNF